MFAMLKFSPFTGKRTEKTANLVCSAALIGAPGGPLDGAELGGLSIWKNDDGSFATALPKSGYRPVIGPKRVVSEDVEGFSISGSHQVDKLKTVIARIYNDAKLEENGTDAKSVYTRTFDLASALGSATAAETA